MPLKIKFKAKNIALTTTSTTFSPLPRPRRFATHIEKVVVSCVVVLYPSRSALPSSQLKRAESMAFEESEYIQLGKNTVEGSTRAAGEG
jgi:hypothetical protein